MGHIARDAKHVPKVRKRTRSVFDWLAWASASWDALASRVAALLALQALCHRDETLVRVKPRYQDGLVEIEAVRVQGDVRPRAQKQKHAR